MSRRTKVLAGLVAVAVTLLLGTGIWQATRQPSTVTLQDRAVAVERSLRCPTCQGLSVADSPSPIAAGMRERIQAQLRAGATPAQVRRYFTSKYGDWILLEPPRRGLAWLLWLAPGAVLLGGLVLLTRTLRRRTAVRVSAQELTAAALFADTPCTHPFPEAITAALSDVHAARTDAELDPFSEAGAHDALARLAIALRDHAAAPASDEAQEAHPGDRAGTDAHPAETPARLSRPRPTPLRYAMPATAVLFAALLTITLTRSLTDRPAGAVPTGDFATTATTAPTTAELSALRQATTSRPRDPRTWLAYATALDAADSPTAAELAYHTALRLQPRSLPARSGLAWLLIRTEHPDQALDVLAPLQPEKSATPRVVLLSGLAQRAAGKPQAAATLHRYLRLAPSGPVAEAIRSLLSHP